jgi:hypothetical protein
MEPKEKASALVSTYMSKVVSKTFAKELVLIAVDEIRYIMNITQNYEGAVYWREVKQEIEKL